ncbi:hypothetical protein CLOM_g4383 [Closterium sp. NIES-68]|nr:hypothetical protein CLOM_g4383 [Closterium sp. NIES-68]GJP83037.1 hypothetical protein CLOP_g13247 [Closterium sp. NIES-67]GJP86943.1 hypothetical protein CLOP_g16905 [Closterium sp. NIES-67]
MASLGSSRSSTPALILFSLLFITPATHFFTSSSLHGSGGGRPSSSPYLCQAVKIYKPDQTILLYLKSRWTGFQYADSWVSGTDCSTWQGVTCDARSGAVTRLDFSGAWINGTIPPAIGNLTALTSLVFWGNTLAGRLPSSIGLLTRLQELRIGDNGPGMSGGIPNTLSRLTNLFYLDLSRNRFAGPIPAFILGGTMKKLDTLDLSGNRLTGRIPGAKLGALSVLKTLGLSDNRLSGIIPTEIGRLTALTYLMIVNNRLEGPLPSSLASCTGLVRLTAGGNRLGGPLPTGMLLRLTKLEGISLNRNGFVVTSLAPLANHPKLKDIDLSQNRVARRILATLGQMKNIQSLNLARNRLTGSVPAFLLANQPKLYGLDLSFNRLSGNFPWAAVRGAPELAWLNIQHNLFSGRMPEISFTGQRMQVLNMSNNFFSGSLPNFGNPEGEYNLDVRDNFFSSRPEIRAWGKRVCPIEGQTAKPPDDETVFLTVARNCLSQVPGCKVTSQRKPASCAAFCGANGKSGACGGHGTCVPKAVGGKATFACVCDKGFALKPGNAFACL